MTRHLGAYWRLWGSYWMITAFEAHGRSWFCVFRPGFGHAARPSRHALSNPGRAPFFGASFATCNATRGRIYSFETAPRDGGGRSGPFAAAPSDFPSCSRLFRLSNAGRGGGRGGGRGFGGRDGGRGGGRGFGGGRGGGRGFGGRDGGRGGGRGGGAVGLAEAAVDLVGVEGWAKRGGMKGGARVIVEGHRHDGVFVARGKGGRAGDEEHGTWGVCVRREKRISVEGPGEGAEKVEYRVWNPFRSKLAAGRACRGGQHLHEARLQGAVPGAASGTSVSHVSDLVGPEGTVYGGRVFA